MNNSNKIIINTAFSYLALLLKMIVGLFTVRYVLQALGEVDYGVYIIVGGVVAMLDILNSNMSNTSMRYLAYSLGNKNKEDICVTFNTTVFIHYFIGLASILILEVGGFFMFEYIVNIPSDRIGDAKIIYQFMIASTFISVISVPYDALTNAHEKIWILSVFDMIDVCMNLALVLFLLRYNGNRLVLYGFCLMLIQLVLRVAKVSYAKKKFEECRKIKREYIIKQRIREILAFTGWNLLGSVSALGAGQIRSLIVNFFFGVRLNAAEGITRQVSKPLTMIVTSMTRAINPQIMKSEGGQNRERMKFVVAIGSKYSSFLFAILGIPVLFELPFLLDIWLGNVPEYAVEFCQLTILAMLIEKFTYQITHAISAVGNIKGYQIAHAIGNFVYLPISFFLFKNGYSPVTIYLLYFISIVLNALFRFHFGRTVAGINTWSFIKNAILPVLWPLLISTVITLLVYFYVDKGLLNVLAVFFVFCLSFPVLFWFIGMDQQEHERWVNIVKQMKNKTLRKRR